MIYDIHIDSINGICSNLKTNRLYMFIATVQYVQYIIVLTAQFFPLVATLYSYFHRRSF